MIARPNDVKPFARRAGFTLVELLTVIAIIAVLVSLVASATFQVIGVQQQRTTETTIKKVADALDQQWQAVVDQARKETVLKLNVSSFAGDDERRKKVVWVKLRLMQEFPMNFSEAKVPPVYGTQSLFDPRPSYFDALGGDVYAPPGPNVDPDFQASACLYLALKQNRRGMNFDIDSALSAAEVGTASFPFTARSDGTTKVFTFNTIVDAWGNPLVFYRWPTDNTELTPSSGWTGTPFLRDPQDPEGTLSTLSGPTWPAGTFVTLCHKLLGPAGSPPHPQSYYLVPVVASVGARYAQKTKIAAANSKVSVFGLTAAMGPDGTGNDIGNIYSYRLREGARGD
jgi:prepilin-type N-terminal cleavage/methylation domain-containing protein